MYIYTYAKTRGTHASIRWRMHMHVGPVRSLMNTVGAFIPCVTHPVRSFAVLRYPENFFFEFRRGRVFVKHCITQGYEPL